MQPFLKKILWHYYAITLLLFAASLFWVWTADTPDTGDDFFDGLEQLARRIHSFLILMPLTTCFVAYRLGRKSAHLPWMYSVFAPVLSGLVAALPLHPQSALGHGFLLLYPLGQFVLAIAGLALGRALTSTNTEQT